MLYEFDSKRPRIDPSAYVSDSATIIGDVQIGARCYVGPGAIIRGDAKPIVIGEESAVEDGVIIHVGGAATQGCVIGRRVTIGPRGDSPRQPSARRGEYRHGRHSQHLRRSWRIRRCGRRRRCKARAGGPSPRRGRRRPRRQAARAAGQGP